jgi:hypothetical protein
MKKKIITIGIICMFLLTSFASLSVIGIKTQMKNNEPQFIKNENNLKWKKTFNNSMVDEGHCVKQTNDGGYIILGSMWDYNAMGQFLWLIKTDKNGDKEWDKIYGGSDNYGGYINLGLFIEQTNDGGYIIVGTTSIYGAGGLDVWLIKTYENGDEEWNKTYGGSNDNEWGTSAHQTSDGGFIISATTQIGGSFGPCDAWLIKTDDLGNIEWDKTFKEEDNDYYAVGVEQISGEGYILFGYTTWDYSRCSDAWLIKTDNDGNELWKKIYDDSYNEKFMYGLQTEDKGYIMTGYITEKQPDTQDFLLLVVKTDSDGNEEWYKTFEAENYDYEGHCIDQTADGGYIITGVKEYDEHVSIDSIRDDDVLLIKIAAEGNKQWENTFGGEPNNQNGVFVQQTSDSGYIVTGSIDDDHGSDVWLIKTDENGNVKNKAISKSTNLCLSILEKFMGNFPLLSRLLDLQ